MCFFLTIREHFPENRRNTKTPAVVKFISALHFFAHGSYQKSVGQDRLCSMSQDTVSKTLHEFVDIMLRHLANRYVKFPTTFEETVAVKTGFYNEFHIPGIMGCIDGTHVKIFPPPAQHLIYPGNIFINRKNFHSINCQIICDHNLQILAIDARFLGSVHDSAIWMMSSIKRKLKNNYDNGDRNAWLLGDAGYPLQPFLLTPIVGAEPGTPQARYTAAHTPTRNCVERCIGVLKAYFRCYTVTEY
jgi:hypothetical protein